MSKEANVLRMLQSNAEPADGGPEGPADAPAEGEAQPTGLEEVSPSGEAAAGDPGQPAAPADDRKSRLRESIKEIRERREAASLVKEAQRLMSEAKAAKEAAEAELNERRTALKAGWKDGLKALGYDPLAVFDEMTQEAIKSGTPEAQMASMQEKFLRAIEPLQQEIERLRAREREAEAAQYEASFRSAVVQASAAPEYENLSVYEPHEIIEAARLVGDRLTAAGEQVTVREILDVLALQQRQYDERVQKKRGATQVRTVNGTVSRQTEALGNSTVSQTLPRSEEDDLPTDPVARRKARVARMLARATGG